MTSTQPVALAHVSQESVDALIVGAGPAGCATAILLAAAGWRVVLVEQHEYPRQKVCGECLSAGSLSVLDRLGVGREFGAIAGPEIRNVGWMGSGATVVADFPACTQGEHRYGRALGRDRLDELLLHRAQRLGVEVLQPAKVRRVGGTAGDFLCDIKVRSGGDVGERAELRSKQRAESDSNQSRRARIVVDAHGSWEAGPALAGGTAVTAPARLPKRDSDLFAFKASFAASTLSPGLLPVIALDGGYGGVVVAEDGRTTLACCIRRDTLKLIRAAMPGASASDAVARHLEKCGAIQEILRAQRRIGPWLAVGPVRPGIRDGVADIFRVGNAAGETHPLMGEGISMALQSAALLAQHLVAQRVGELDAQRIRDVNRRYVADWRAAFAPRLRFAAVCAQAAMRPAIAGPLTTLLDCWPALLTRAARWGAKARPCVVAFQAAAGDFEAA